MNARDFQQVYLELIDENPLAIRAVLKVLRVEFTDTVPTLAVTCEARPRLLVNLAFVRAHCRTEAHVKAVICHEFLHVLLRHTERFTTLTQAEHLAVDAVINAIIHRSLGPDYSGMMSRYYADERGIARLLRPPTDSERERVKRMPWSEYQRERTAHLVRVDWPLRLRAIRRRRHS
jgi:predicted metal-dependent peptidase